MVIISRAKGKHRWKFLRSVRFRIMVIVMLMGIIPSIVVENVIVQSYEDRALSQRTIIIQNQSNIISNQLVQLGYMEDQSNAVINGEISMLTNIYEGRILIINRDYEVIKDTYELDRGKYLISKEVINCFNGQDTSQYDKRNQYIEMTVPISDPESADKEIIGVMLISVSTVEINDSKDMLEQRGTMILGILVILILVFSYILSGILVKPFQKITRSIEELTDGYLDESISVPDYLETELITDAFNKMLARVKTLDDSRQEFVSNVSHELKTPLASMKVLADSLNVQENVPIEQYQEFMHDISEEIDRENSIITDLLSLVKMDKKASDLNIETVNINDLLELVLKRLRPIAGKKQVELILDSFRPVNAEVDATKLTPGFFQSGGKRHQIQPAGGRLGKGLPECGSQIFLCDGGRFRNRHSGGIPESHF